MAMLAQSLDSIIRKADGAFESFDSAMAKIGDVGPSLVTLRALIQVASHMQLLSRPVQRLEQHRSGVGRRQKSLRFDPPIEFLVQPLEWTERRMNCLRG